MIDPAARLATINAEAKAQRIERDKIIHQLRASGWTLTAIAEVAGLSVGRVHKIVKSQAPE